jgi:hypothetical protein
MISEERKPEILKDIADVLKTAIQLDEVKPERAIKYLKENLPNLSKFIDDNKGEILQGLEKKEMDEQKKVRIVKKLMEAQKRRKLKLLGLEQENYI